MVQKPGTISRISFLKSDKAVMLRDELEKMVASPLYNTKVVTLLETNSSFFVEKHMKYMSEHLKMDHSQYVQNLRLMTRLR